jgi:outer membrane protein OmpU
VAKLHHSRAHSSGNDWKPCKTGPEKVKPEHTHSRFSGSGLIFSTRGKLMKNLLIATTALVATAGMASAEITFSGKGEAGMYRTAKVKAVAQKFGTAVTVTSAAATDVLDLTGTLASVDYNADGALTVTAADLVDASAAAAVAHTGDAADVTRIKAAITVATAAAEAAGNAAVVHEAAGAVADAVVDRDLQTAALAQLARHEAELAVVQGTAAVVAKAAGDMVAYSGYDMNVAMSAESDNGIVFGMGFDMGAGLIADQNDDRAMDPQGATIATSALTATMNGFTLSIGSDKLDDTYDDGQNGDIGLSGNVGGIAFNLVHDLTDEVVAKAATYTAASSTASNGRAATTDVVTNAAGVVIDTSSASTRATGDSDYVAASYTDKVEATIETTSLSLGGAVGDIAWSLAATTGNKFGDSAAKGSVTYSGIENLSLTLAHDNVGKLEGISKVTAAYTMGSLTATLSMADDKNKNSNSNAGGKASNNLSLAYAANGLAATFATDESSQWWVNTQYDLGGGAQAFATIDHTEFAVVGLNFAF